MIKSMKKKYIIAAVFVLILFTALIYVFQREEPMPEAIKAMLPDDKISITVERDFIVFQSRTIKTETALIIYPGARVDPRAYAPIARAFAEKGVRTILTKMPLNLAILDYNKADKIIARYDIKNWYIAGHSLGGVMAARYAKKNQDVIDGLILWASYPEKSSDLSDSTMPVMSIYGTNDGLTQPGDISDNRHLLPETVQWISIKGANHSQFGWYGFQKGDEPADISREEQQKEIVESTMELIKSNN
ncbi:MAG: hypothetical protein A2Y23_15435 [Clostridiales bacterium GWB2_37_7]|nr:MAG: hypothetical protein A2Y23_15435 [Clostridiales bacterium GWB2_37_7]